MPFEHNAVVVEGQLHVTRNVIIEGGTMNEGEVGILHVTAPIEWQQTEIGLYEEGITNCVISGQGASLGFVDGYSQIRELRLPPHTHYFKNLPLTLLQHPEAVREKMITKGINSRARIAASDVADNAWNCLVSPREEAIFHRFAFFALKDALGLPTVENYHYTYTNADKANWITAYSAPIVVGQEQAWMNNISGLIPVFPWGGSKLCERLSQPGETERIKIVWRWRVAYTKTVGRNIEVVGYRNDGRLDEGGLQATILGGS
jgi:hypothetical protein